MNNKLKWSDITGKSHEDDGEVTQETIDELSNGKGDDEDE